MAPATEASFLKYNKQYSGNSGREIPEWINQHFLQETLHNNSIEFKKICKFTVTPAVNQNENHASTIFRINLEVELKDGKSKKFFFILKMTSDSVKTLIMSLRLKLFTREVLMYKEFIPEFEELFRRMGKCVKLAPTSYSFVKQSEFEGILVDNLHEFGFKRANRLTGLDIEHTKCVLRKLAELHSASAHRFAISGNYPECFEHGFVTQENRNMFDEIAAHRTQSLLECMNEYRLDSEAKEKIKKLRSCHTDLYMKYSRINENDFNVLNHGDCWVNNILFRYDAFGKIKETLFIDFQVSKYGTFAQDFYFFLFSSTNFEIKLNNFDFFIKYYYENLLENLQLLRYPKKIPTLENLNAELNKYSFWGYVACTSILATTLFDGSKDYFHFRNDKFDYWRVMYSNPRYVEQVVAIVPWLNQRYSMTELN